MRSFLLASMACVGLAAPAQARDLVLAVGGESDAGFDPVQGWGAYGAPLFQSTLLRLDADLQLVGDLATDWTLSEDRRTWVLNLRDDARFSDGPPVTAADVAFTFNAARDATGLVDLTAMEAALATGPHTVEIALKRPQITFTRQLASLGIVPEAGHGDDYAQAPVGSGPFQMVEWRPGETLIVEPNPHWYGPEIAFDRISFVFGAEDVSVAMARAGNAHLVAVPPAQAGAVPQGMRLLRIDSVDNRGLMFPMRPDTGETAENGAPIGNDVTADPAIRVAINQGLDRDALVALALDGYGRPALGPVDGLPWDNPQAGIAGSDPQAAKATLEAAGWTDTDDDGIREKDGVTARFSIVYPSSDSLRQALAVGAAQQIRALGIDAQPAGKSWDEIGRLMHSEVVVFGWGAHDPSEIANLYGQALAGKGYFNPGFYANPAVEAHFAAAQAAPDFAASLPHWQAAQWDGTTGFGARGDAAWAWLVNLEHTYFVDECLDTGQTRIHPHGHGFPITWNIADWSWTCE